MADPTGFEPMTSTSVVWRSNPAELRVRISREEPIELQLPGYGFKQQTREGSNYLFIQQKQTDMKIIN